LAKQLGLQDDEVVVLVELGAGQCAKQSRALEGVESAADGFQEVTKTELDLARLHHRQQHRGPVGRRYNNRLRKPGVREIRRERRR